MTPKVTPTYPRGVSASCLLHYTGLLVLALLLVLPGRAAEALKARFDLPAGAAEKTLKQFSEQAGREVLFGSSVTKSVKTNPVSGEFTPREALEAMLADTGLMVVADEKTGSFSVRKETSLEAKNVNRAIAEDSDRPEKNAKSDGSKIEDGVMKMPDVMVVGQKTMNVDLRRTANDPQPYVVFDAKEIESSQATDLQEFLNKRLTMNTMAGSPSTQGGDAGNYSLVTLRGLGPEQTLILVDGRRAPRLASGIGFVQADLNGIPLSSIERIEVLPSTAGGIYGGGAVGGVLNIIRKRNYRGLSVLVNYDGTFQGGGTTRRFATQGGLTLNNGNTLIEFSAAYQKSDPLYRTDNGLWTRGTNLIAARGPDGYVGSGYTTNIYASQILGANSTLTRPNLVLRNGTPLNANRLSIPIGYSGVALDNGAGLLGAAGQISTQFSNDAAGTNGRYQTLKNGARVSSWNLNVRQVINPAVEVFADLNTAKNDGLNYTQRGELVSISRTLTSNPFLQNIQVYIPLVGLSPTPSKFESDTIATSVGLMAKLGHGWTGLLEYDCSQYQYESTSWSSTLNAKFTQDVRSGLINIFKDLNLSPLDYSPYLIPGPDQKSGPFKTIQQVASARLSGPTLDIRGVPINLTTLAERREERAKQGLFTSTGSYVVYPDRKQTVNSLYAEVVLPMVTSKDKWLFSKQWEIQGAIRYDAYKTVGAQPSFPLPTGTPIPTGQSNEDRFKKATYTLATLWSPLDGLKFRASYATGFLPPGINQINPDIQANSFNVSTLIDPKRSEAIGQTTYISGGNTNLGPERSHSANVGLIFEPKYLPGFRLSVDYSRINKTGEVNMIPAEYLLAHEEQFPGRILRDPTVNGVPGHINTFDVSNFNLSSTSIAALDLQVKYTRQLGSTGTVQAYATLTRQSVFERQVLSGDPIKNLAGLYAGPLQWRGVLGISWTRGPLAIDWNAQFYDSAKLQPPGDFAISTYQRYIQVLGAGKIPAQSYHDIAVSYKIPVGQDVFSSGNEIVVGISNLFNKMPPVFADRPYYSLYGDPRLRWYSVTWKKAF